MRTTVNLDESLLAKAIKLTGPLDRSALLHEGLKALSNVRVLNAWRSWGAANQN